MQRSRFLTLLALFTIVTSAGSTLLFGAQNILFNFVLGDAQLPFLLPEVHSKLPPSIGFLLGHLRPLLAAMLALSVIAFLCGLGLLFRINLARLAFILLLLISIGWNLGMLYLQHQSTSAMVELANAAGGAVTEDMAAWALLAGAAVSTLICLLSLWLIGWLMWARVKAEFGVYR